MSDTVAIASGAITARIDPLGAELVSLTDREGREYMSDGDPAWWTGRAPLLFPIVGALNGGRYRLAGREYAMDKHGFARRSPFVCEEHEQSARARFALEDNDATRAIYPFAFRLELLFAVDADTLSVTATVTNRGDRAMPFSFGFHPAFAWPMPGGAAKDAHRIVFALPQPEPVRRIDLPTGLLLPAPQPSPVDGGTLVPTAEMFEPDALIWDAPASRACTFGAPGGGSVALRWENLPMLGVWQKPGAPFLCIEPWQGIADPRGFTGDFRDKPGVVELAPGTSATFQLSITVTPAETHP